MKLNSDIQQHTNCLAYIYSKGVKRGYLIKTPEKWIGVFTTKRYDMNIQGVTLSNVNIVKIKSKIKDQ